MKRIKKIIQKNSFEDGMIFECELFPESNFDCRQSSSNHLKLHNLLKIQKKLSTKIAVSIFYLFQRLLIFWQIVSHF